MRGLSSRQQAAPLAAAVATPPTPVRHPGSHRTTRSFGAMRRHALLVAAANPWCGCSSTPVLPTARSSSSPGQHVQRRRPAVAPRSLGGGGADAAAAVQPAPAADATTTTSSSNGSSPPQQQQQQQEEGSLVDGAAQAASEWDAEIEETLKLVCLLPPAVRAVVEAHPRLHELLEVVMDLGRPPTARFPRADERLADSPVTQDDLDYAVAQVGAFGGDNRAGIDATLHRISCMRNRAGRIVGLTCRVGRAIHGSAGLVADLVSGGASVLFMGRPGVGKTTAIRELSRLLADDLGRRVVIVDTSNEIGGDGDVPHAGIGRARRMQVPDPEAQHRVMIEAVENHMPQVVVIDEIGTEAECSAARTIAQRGVQLVATAHGNELANLVKNPALSDLIGGIQSVTLGDDEAKRRGVQKSILERAAPPTFDVAVEMLERCRWCVYTDVAAAVDALLGGQHPGGQMRERGPDGAISKYTFSSSSSSSNGGGSSSSSQGAGAAAAEGDLLARLGSSGSARVLPELLRPGTPADSGSGGDLFPPGGAASSFLRARLPDSRSAADDGLGSSASTVTRRGRSIQLGLPSPEGAALRLYASELDEERLWEVMSAMGLHHQVFIAPRPAEADAVLAVRSRLRGNPSLRAAARDAGVPVYAIKSSSSSNLIRAFRTLLGQEPLPGGVLGSRGSMDEGGLVLGGGPGGLSGDSGSSSGEDDEPGGEAAAPASSVQQQPRGGPVRALQLEEEGLQEARLAAESIVVPLQQPVELLPRPEHVRRAQAALAAQLGLAAEVVGGGGEARVRLCPLPAPAGAAVGATAE